jgi:HEAT repeat protein
MFMSYAHHDDNDGRLTRFRDRLLDELHAQTGRHIAIFKDDDDISLGERWRDRLNTGLATSTFLLPIVTPSFLTSTYCRDEVETFLAHQQELARNDLVLPIYYIDCQEFLNLETDREATATLRAVLDSQYFNWRELRLRKPSDPPVVQARSELATKIRVAMARVPASPDPPSTTPHLDPQRPKEGHVTTGALGAAAVRAAQNTESKPASGDDKIVIAKRILTVELEAARRVARNEVLEPRKWPVGRETMWRESWLTHRSDLVTPLGADYAELAVAFDYVGRLQDGLRSGPREFIESDQAFLEAALDSIERGLAIVQLEGTARPREEPPQVRARAAAPAAPAALPALLDALFDADPVTSRPAADELAQRGPDVIPSVVERLHDLSSPPTIFVVRELLSRFPEASGPLMTERIRAADRSWHEAVLVPQCLSSGHRPWCEQVLTAMLRPATTKIDSVRLAIEALGYVAALEQTHTIVEFLREMAEDSPGDLYNKYASYCIEALARLASRVPLESAFRFGPAAAFADLETAVRLIGSVRWRGSAYESVQKILGRADPHNGDRFAYSWLGSPDEDLRDLGAYAVGGVGLRRIVPALLERCVDSGESPRVRRTAMFASGIIGGREAVTRLSALEVSGQLAAAREQGLTMCVGDVADDDEFRQLSRRLIAGNAPEKCFVYRAIGRRGDQSLSSLVRDGLRDSESSVRGDAALALARLSGASELDSLFRARAEASSTRERLMTSLGLLATGANLPDDPDLADFRELLAGESFAFRSATQRDILETLRSSSHQLASAVADAWQPIYDASSAY